MKKIVIIDGGPRKTMNTAQMVEAFAKGAKAVSEEIEVRHIRLYDLEAYKGCVSCLACKLKDTKFSDVCARKDGITEALREAAYADGLVFATPIYWLQPTAQLRAFIERLLFPWLSYANYKVTPPKQMPTAIIYTLSGSPEFRPMLDPHMEHIEGLIAMGLPKPEHIEAINTMMVSDKAYDRYDVAPDTVEKKRQWHSEQWERDLQNATDAGRRMAEKILSEN